MNKVKVSKALAYILRHGGKDEGIEFDDEGYAKVNDLLKNYRFKNMNVTLNDIQSIVQTNDKQRFQLKQKSPTNEWLIRAVQGHSIQFKNMGYTKITNADEIPGAVHGTYYNAWNIIKKEGLHRMSRTHIHFAIGTLESNVNVISGMRKDCQVYIHLDIDKCLQDNIEILLSENKVVLVNGNGPDGALLPKYFKSVIDRKTGKEIGNI